MSNSFKSTLRGLFLLGALSSIGCATQSVADEAETVGTLRSVDGSSYAAPIHHDAPPSERGSEFKVASHRANSNGALKGGDLPAEVTKSSHGF